MSEQRKQKVQRRVVAVLENMIKMANEDVGDAKMLSESLEIMLDDIHSDDGFGTEGQCDPRGDFRNKKWSMSRVEGVDS